MSTGGRREDIPENLAPAPNATGRLIASPILPIAVRARLATTPSSSRSPSAYSSSCSSTPPASPLLQSHLKSLPCSSTMSSSDSGSISVAASSTQDSPSVPPTSNLFRPAASPCLPAAVSLAATSATATCKTRPPSPPPSRACMSAGNDAAVCTRNEDEAVQMPTNGRLRLDSRGKVKIRPRVNVDEQDYPRVKISKMPGLSMGTSMAVHHTGRIYAVSGGVGSGFSPTKCDPFLDRDRATCLIHVHSLCSQSEGELHFAGPPGPIAEMAFAHSAAAPASEFFLGCIDARSNVGIYRLTTDGFKDFCNLRKENYFIYINNAELETLPFIRWCPFACPEATDEDFSKTLLTVVGGKVEVLHLQKIRTEGQATYTAQSFDASSRQVFEDHGAIIVDAKISPDGSGFATASMDGTIKFYLAEGNSKTDGYSFADFYECENDDRITSITFPDDITHRRSDLYPWSRIIVGLNGNLKFMLIDLTEKDKPTLQTIELMIGDPSSPTVQPRALAVSPDGKFFLISGCNSKLFHFGLINRHIAAVTEIDLKEGIAIASMSIVLDCAHLHLSGSSFEFFVKCERSGGGGGEARCLVELDNAHSSPYSTSSAVKRKREELAECPADDKLGHGNRSTDGTLEDDNLSAIYEKEDGKAAFAEANHCEDDSNDGDVIVEHVEETVDGDEENVPPSHLSNDQNVDVVLETCEPDEEDHVSQNDDNRVEAQSPAASAKQVATNTCDESSPSESVPRMLHDLLSRVHIMEHRMGAMFEILEDIRRNQHEE